MGLIELLLGVVFTLGVGVGFGVGATGDAGNVEFVIARAAFCVAALAVAGAFFYWLSEGDRENRLIIILGIVSGLCVFVGLPFSQKWLDAREAKIRALEEAAENLAHKPSNAQKDRWVWAALTSSESDGLFEALRGKGQHSFHIACSRPECSDLAISFDRLFKRLGWPSFVGDGGFLATGVTGILINPDDAGARLLKSAIETNTILRPDVGSLRGKDTGPTMLVIGAKPEVLASGPLLATTAPGILLDIAFEILPRVSPPDGTIHMFEINEEQTGIQASLVEHQFNPSQVIDWKQRFPDWPIFGVSKCEITSTTNEPVFYAVIPINLRFREMIPDTPGLPPVEIGGVVQSTNGIQMRSGRVMMTQQSSFKVGRIYPQTPYAVYFVNRTKYLVDIEVPSEGKVQDFSKTGADFEQKLNMKMGRTTGLHLSPSPIALKLPPTLLPQTPLPLSTPEKK
jgi:hypothetical protein